MSSMITYQTEFITPTYAKTILDAQADAVIRQRHIDSRKVAQYAKDMVEGRWQENGAAVVLHGTTLLDGQHRLHAIVQANVTLPVLVARGVHPSAFVTIDQGMMRTVPHLLEMRGHAYISTVVSAARRARQYASTGRVSLQKSGFSAQEMLEYIIEHGPALEAASKSATACKLGHVSVLTTFAFLVREHPEGRPFFEQLQTGLSIDTYDPVRMLRELLLVNRRAMGRRASSTITMAWTIVAWNTFLSGRRLKHIMYRPLVDRYPTLSLESRVSDRG